MKAFVPPKKKRLRLLALVCFVMAGLTAFGDLIGFRPFSYAAEVVFDELTRRGKRTTFPDSLVFVGVDANSRSLDPLWPEDIETSQALQLIKKAPPGGWPWSREVHAEIARRLLAAGAKMVLFDFIFLTEAEGDDVFRELIEKENGRVLVGADIRVKDESATMNLPTQTLIPNPGRMDRRIGLVMVPAGEDTAGQRGTIRSMRFKDSWPLHLGKKSSKFYSPEMIAETDYLTYPGQTLRFFGRENEIPADYSDRLFRYSGPPSRVPMVPAWEILFDNTFQPRVDKGEFKDKIVLVGPADPTFHDYHDTPFGKMLGPVLIMQQIAAALASEYLTAPPLWLRILILIACGLVAFAICVKIASPIARTVLILIGSAIPLGFSYLLYNHADFLFNPVGPGALLLFTGLAGTVCDFVLERRERTRVRGHLERFVSRNVVHEILENPEDYLRNVTGVRKRVTVLFSDVRGFTTMSESADPAALVAQLNEYLTAMVALVFEEDGTLDKFMGDAVMAVWGNIRSKGEEDDARRAVSCGLKMRKRLAELNKEWKARGIQELHIGIGLNHGEVIAGEIGSAQKSEPTVIGDAVNVASRLEGMTKPYSIDILLGEELGPLVADHFKIRSVDVVLPKGKTTASEIYTVESDEGGPDEDWMNRFRNALLLYRTAEFHEAVEVLNGLEADRPGDSLVALYLKRCKDYLETPPGPDWDGVYVFTSK